MNSKQGQGSKATQNSDATRHQDSQAKLSQANPPNLFLIHVGDLARHSPPQLANPQEFTKSVISVPSLGEHQTASACMRMHLIYIHMVTYATICSKHMTTPRRLKYTWIILKNRMYPMPHSKSANFIFGIKTSSKNKADITGKGNNL